MFLQQNQPLNYYCSEFFGEMEKEKLYLKTIFLNVGICLIMKKHIKRFNFLPPTETKVYRKRSKVYR